MLREESFSTTDRERGAVIGRTVRGKLRRGGARGTVRADAWLPSWRSKRGGLESGKRRHSWWMSKNWRLLLLVLGYLAGGFGGVGKSVVIILGWRRRRRCLPCHQKSKQEHRKRLHHLTPQNNREHVDEKGARTHWTHWINNIAFRRSRINIESDRKLDQAKRHVIRA